MENNVENIIKDYMNELVKRRDPIQKRIRRAESRAIQDDCVAALDMLSTEYSQDSYLSGGIGACKELLSRLTK